MSSPALAAQSVMQFSFFFQKPTSVHIPGTVKQIMHIPGLTQPLHVPLQPPYDSLTSQARHYFAWPTLLEEQAGTVIPI